ncbi:multi drugs and toxic compounds exclusion protein [Tripterygium wilfordii]|uniref:MATE efflux family protein FRD3 n=1 Tax=Tripterygium wilfordii TaxID=458696 RepID=A0A7J7CRZ1_TRIWF|nr:MATE efflux family protein FRD3 [Tripterygium wilfordii]KAF5736831.1 multi drugs and toxic compounds exclusion protein [Tripterygium wilfordii]
MSILQFVAATQPINSMDFFFDEVNFGASNYAHSAYSMVGLETIISPKGIMMTCTLKNSCSSLNSPLQVLVAMASIASLFVLSKSNGFVGILVISFNWPSS